MCLARHELESLNIMIAMMITKLSSLAEAAFSCLTDCLQHCSQAQPMADVLAIHAFLQRAVKALHQEQSYATEP